MPPKKIAAPASAVTEQPTENKRTRLQARLSGEGNIEEADGVTQKNPAKPRKKRGESEKGEKSVKRRERELQSVIQKKARAQGSRIKLNDVIEEVSLSVDNSGENQSTSAHGSVVMDPPEDGSNQFTVAAEIHSNDQISGNANIVTVSDSYSVNNATHVDNSYRPEDPITRLANTLDALVASREASVSERDSRLENRLKFANKLPKFSGNPLDWLHFKDTYRATSKLSGFTNRENIARLFEALSGDARDTVQTLLATTSDPEAVMGTLELHYGNKDLVARKLVDDIQNLPDLRKRNADIIRFATKLRNAVDALKSLKRVGHLYRADLIKSVQNKLPSGLTYKYYKYVATLDSDEPNLVKLSNFLNTEAEYATAAGVSDFEPASPSSESERVPHKWSKPTKSAVVCTNVERTPGGNVGADRTNDSSKHCVFCDRTNHTLAECYGFAKQTPERRFFYAKKHRLCYNCGHRQNKYRETRCPFCRRRHHSLLHRPDNKGSGSNSEKGASAHKHPNPMVLVTKD